MDLVFQEKSIAYLQKLVSQAKSQEETAEVIIQDRDPDIGRIVGCWGIPVIRSKELQQNTMGVSGGITAWVLYVPEDGSAPRQAATYLPFTMKWDIPSTERDGSMLVTCGLQSIDARMVNSRKLLVRATVSCEASLHTSGEAVFHTLENPPKELEVLRDRLSLRLPSEVAEKSFTLDDELELPGGTPEIDRIVAYQLTPQVRDSKVLGEKALFKGICGIHLIYMTPEERLATWDFELPFSQYTELSRHYDQEETLQTSLLLTGTELDTAEDRRHLLLKCGICAQCSVLCEQVLDVVMDLYGVRQAVKPEFSTLPIRSRLDRQQLQTMAEIQFPMRGSSLIDSTVLPGTSRVSRSGDNASIEIPVWCSILYYDEDGSLQGRNSRDSTRAELRLADGCPLESTGQPSGPVQWTPGSAGTQVRIPMSIIADSYSDQELTMVSGAQVADAIRPDPNRPSVIIRAPSPEDTLWTLAKTYGSTVSAIQGANHLNGGISGNEKLLLIPIL